MITKIVNRQAQGFTVEVEEHKEPLHGLSPGGTQYLYSLRGKVVKGIAPCKVGESFEVRDGTFKATFLLLDTEGNIKSNGPYTL